MRSETFIIIITLFHVNRIPSGVTTASRSSEKSDLSQTRTNIQQSFKELIRNIIAFFDLSIGKIEVRRQKIKKAFFKFLDESLKDHPTESIQPRRFWNNFENIDTALSSLIISHGYHIETHSVLTVDGYILTLHKIKLEDDKSVNRGKIVLFQHGIFGSSVDWFQLGPKKSLPYMVLNYGCEVWIANSRGNIFSRSHVSKVINSPEFWDYTLHEMGMYDLSATLDYIIDASNKKSEIIFVGHSSGCATLLILLSAAPRYNGLIKLGIFLAPVVFVSHTKGPVRYLSFLYSQDETRILSKNTKGEFLARGAAMDEVINIFCDKHTNKNAFACLRYNGKEEVAGNLSTAIVDAASSGGSQKVLVHLFQMMKSGHLQKFDYGREGNVLKYGQLVPPRYDLEEVSLPLHVFTSSDDLLSNEEDVNKLVQELPKVADHIVITRKGFSHVHFLFDQFIAELLYNKTFHLFN